MLSTASVDYLGFVDYNAVVEALPVIKAIDLAVVDDCNAVVADCCCQ
jgi:hypothetical protein